MLVDLKSNSALSQLRNTQDDMRFAGSAQGHIGVGHVGQPNTNIHHDAPPGSGLLYSGGGRRRRRRSRKSRKSRKGGRRHKSRKSHKKRKSYRKRVSGKKQRRSKRARHTRRRKGGAYVSMNPASHPSLLIGPKTGHPGFERGTNPGFHAPHKLGAGVQHVGQQQKGGNKPVSMYSSQSHAGTPYYTTSMDNSSILRGSYPEITPKLHGTHGGRRRKSRRGPYGHGGRKVTTHAKRKRRTRAKRGGYHQYLGGTSRSFGYHTAGKLQPHESALAGHGLSGAYKMGGYGMQGNYNHFTNRNW